MKLGKAGLDLIKYYEGYHKALPNGDCKAYPDPGSISGLPITIGYGTTKYRNAGLAKYGRTNVKLSDTLTHAEAELELQEALEFFSAAVNKMTKALNQNQFDAAVSFFYNNGTGTLTEPTKQAQRLKSGDLAGFRRMLLAYVKGGDGNPMVGLQRRRQAERDLWDKPIEEKEMRTDLALLKKTGRRYGAEWAGLEEMTLELGDKSWRVASGVPGRQTFRKAEDSQSMPGSLEPIPQGVYLLGSIEWAGGKNNWEASWGSAFGPVWQDLRNGQSMRRGAFGIHMDGNMPWSPGSAGCVVFYKTDELKEWIAEFEKYRPAKLIVDWGL